ncbi:hypothetical protein Glove_613g4 [Diversispora epigaea]|uniref:Uncharacterized protein n=1 Tax=Diversispora epigaea TaxID=1348612 RepID=A0A397G9K8_9GLOM|nr:hypothetical protein Glove_613g4 [Diversispora epigaea]
MANIVKIEEGLNKAKEEYRKAEEELKNFMEEGNLKRFKELLGIENLEKEKERLENKEKERWAAFMNWEVMLQGQLVKEKVDEVTPKSILFWIQKYRRPTDKIPPKLIDTYGKNFKFLGREETKERLWNGTLNKNGVKKRYYAYLNNRKDRNLHPIPFIAAGPGTGKTRVLEETLNLLKQCAENDDDSNLKELVNNAVLIDVTYGNGSAATETDSNIGGETSLSLRILYRYFVEGSFNLNFSNFVDIIKNVFSNITDFNLAKVLRTIELDINKENIMIINCIDEVNKLYELDNLTFKTMVNVVGSCSCELGSIFYVPLLAGTIYKPLHKVVTKSMHPPLSIPLPLLKMDHMLEIGQNLQFPVGTNNYFHRCLGDVGGHCRTLEFFYQQCSNYMVNNINFFQVMNEVNVLLNERYAFEEFAHDNSDIIAGCLLDEKMIFNERIQELRQYGIAILEEVQDDPKYIYLRLPYIMLLCLIITSNRTNKLYQFWKPMIDSEELFLWQNWEDFNVRFLALKFCLLSAYGVQEINGCDFLKGAYCGDMLNNIVIKIPEWNTVEIHSIKERFPVNGSWEVTDLDSNKLLIKEKFFAVYKNGEGAPFDGFSYIQLKTANNKDVILACLQTKWRKLETDQPQKITVNMIKKEYESTKKILADKLKLQNNDFIFVLLSICPLSNEIHNPTTLLKDIENAALICKNNFYTFYGFTYATRAKFAAAQEKININIANIWELKLIKGVGENIANNIIQERKRKHFDNENDLCKRTKFPKNAVSLVIFT